MLPAYRGVRERVLEGLESSGDLSLSFIACERGLVLCRVGGWSGMLGVLVTRLGSRTRSDLGPGIESSWHGLAGRVEGYELSVHI